MKFAGLLLSKQKWKIARHERKRLLPMRSIDSCERRNPVTVDRRE